MNLKHSMDIANTIRQQIFASVPMPVVWSWGASAWRMIKENQIDNGESFYYGGLLFYVRGHKHKGQVLVTLTPADTYTITIGHLKKGKISIKKQLKDVYCDELGLKIDELIEKQDNYAF